MRNCLKIRSDLKATYKDQALSNERKQNSLKDHVNVLKRELSVFAERIRVVKGSNSNNFGLVKCYINTMKGFWEQMIKAAHEGEDMLLHLTRGGLRVGDNVLPGQINQQTLNGYTERKLFVQKVFDFGIPITSDYILANNKKFSTDVQDLSNKMSELNRQTSIIRLLEVKVAGYEKLWEEYQMVYKKEIKEYLGILTKIGRAYMVFDLENLRNKISKKGPNTSMQQIRADESSLLFESKMILDDNSTKENLRNVEKRNPSFRSSMDRLITSFKENESLIKSMLDTLVEVYQTKSETEVNESFRRLVAGITSGGWLANELKNNTIPKLKSEYLQILQSERGRG